MSPSTTRWPGRVAAVLIAALLIPMMAASASAAQFSDVPRSHEFYDEIEWLANEKIANGWDDGTFRPLNNITREQMAAFLYRLADSPKVSVPAESPFADVSPRATFYKEIVWLANEEIANGWDDGTFRPLADITREQMAAFLYRYARFIAGEPARTSTAATSFRDIHSRSAFLNEISWLAKSGITTGYADNTFRPLYPVKREAMAAFLYRLSIDQIPSSFTVAGAGFGHGVGMSQYGAQGMAVDGRSAGDILEHYYQGTSVSTVDADKTISVELFGSGADSRDRMDMVVRSPGSDATDDGKWTLRFYDHSPATAHTTWNGKNNEKLHLQRSGNSVKVTRDNGVTATAAKSLILQWESTSYYASASPEEPYVELLKTDGTRATHGLYRHGRLRISVPSTSYPRLIVANQLKLNTEYLYGIAEMPSSWNSEALQAQAIVARGYALRQMGSKAPGCDCHLYDDTRSQNFTGWQKENEGTNAYYGKRWVGAVDATTTSGGRDGKVLKSGGSIAQTYYFSSSGGRTENSENIWSATLSYLRAVDDPWSLESRNPNRAWTRTLTQSQAQGIFGLRDVVSIKVTARTSGSSQSAAKTVTATSSTGQKSSITGPESIRSRIVGGKSPWIWSFTAKY